MTGALETKALILVETELKLHPEAGYMDCYKLIFQGAFGPGHFIPSAKIALEYLRHELAEAREFDPVRVQNVGLVRDFVRVNLICVREGLITAEQLAAAFVESCLPPPMSSVRWAAEWKKIDAQLPGMMEYESEEREALLGQLKTGLCQVSHSAKYRIAYYPHYRVVRKTILGKYVDPRILEET
jgi:hypothetical protein